MGFGAGDPHSQAGRAGRTHPAGFWRGRRWSDARWADFSAFDVIEQGHIADPLNTQLTTCTHCSLFVLMSIEPLCKAGQEGFG